MKLYAPQHKRLDYSCYCKCRYCWLRKDEKRFVHKSARQEVKKIIRDELRQYA